MCPDKLNLAIERGAFESRRFLPHLKVAWITTPAEIQAQLFKKD